MGRAKIALHSQLSSEGVIAEMFTLCFGKNGGALYDSRLCVHHERGAADCRGICVPARCSTVGVFVDGVLADRCPQLSRDARAGGMLLGELQQPVAPPVVVTPIHDSSNVYYTVHLKGMAIDGEDVGVSIPAFNERYGTVLDSGTTFSYLPTGAYLLVKERLRQHANKHGIKEKPPPFDSHEDLCWERCALHSLVNIPACSHCANLTPIADCSGTMNRFV